MSCLKKGELLFYAEGSLPEAQREAAQAHLLGCTRCEADLRQLIAAGSRIDTRMAALGESSNHDAVDVEPRLALLMNRVHERTVVEGKRARRARALGWAAAFAACLAAALFVSDSQRPQLSPRNGSAIAASPKNHLAPAASAQGSLGSVIRGRQQTHSDPMADYIRLDPGAPMQMGVVVRMALPSTMFAGIGANSTNVQADVLVGDDGLPHAIKLVAQQ